MPNSLERSLLLLGGPPGVGKSSTLPFLADAVDGCRAIDADDVWSPATFAERDAQGHHGIAKVIDAVDACYRDGARRVVLSWVFARQEMYQPFLDHFVNRLDELHQLYLVASASVIEARLTARDEASKLSYALSRLDLICGLPFTRIDTTHLSPGQAAAALRIATGWR